jgi:LacI family transcriptional regulator
MESKLLELRIPRILINFPPIGAKVDSVIWDAYDSVRQAVYYLQQQGHTRILYTGDNASLRGYRLRWSAFQEVMSSAGLPADPADHMTVSYSQSNEWLDHFRQIALRTKPTAVINTIAADLPWLLYGISSAGLQSPHSCSLINLGFMANSGDEAYNHTYTPIKEAGYRAAELMIWRIANPLQPYEHIRLQVELKKESIEAIFQK